MINDLSLGPTLGEGVYTLPDAARILGIPQHKLRRWACGYSWLDRAEKRKHSAPLVSQGLWSHATVRAMNFYALIELFTLVALRDIGVTLPRIKAARSDLSQRYRTPYPFASHQIMSDGRNVLIRLREAEDSPLLSLGTRGQTELRRIVEPFCKKLEFSTSNELVSRFWPLGTDRSIVVDPHHGFGKPTISRTNVITETLYRLVRAGETVENVAGLYDLTTNAIQDAVAFETKAA